MSLTSEGSHRGLSPTAMTRMSDHGNEPLVSKVPEQTAPLVTQRMHSFDSDCEDEDGGHSNGGVDQSTKKKILEKIGVRGGGKVRNTADSSPTKKNFSPKIDGKKKTMFSSSLSSSLSSSPPKTGKKKMGVREHVSNRAAATEALRGRSSTRPDDKKSSWRRSLSRHGSRNSLQDDPDDYDDDLGEDADPLVAIFQGHKTQRVRFDMAAVESSDGTSYGGNEKDKKTASKNIKQFMRTTLFGAKESGSNSDVDITDCGSPESAKSEKDRISDIKGSIRLVRSFSPPILRAGSDRPMSPGRLKRFVLPTEKQEWEDFQEDPVKKEEIKKLMRKGQRAQNTHFRYEYAIKYYLEAIELLKKKKYPEQHPTYVNAVESLTDAHHAVTSLKNSANIVKMGIRHEDAGEFVKSLKMYTIAYRIRRDSLGPNHPSLVVLLNMLGSVQMKRGELLEAMQIYKLALNGRPDERIDSGRLKKQRDPLTMSVTLREMGTIFEHWGQDDAALKKYGDSLECVLKARPDLLANPTDDSDDSETLSRMGGFFISAAGGERRESATSKHKQSVPTSPSQVQHSPGEDRNASSRMLQHQQGKDGEKLKRGNALGKKEDGEDGEMEIILEGTGSGLLSSINNGDFATGYSGLYDGIFPENTMDDSPKKRSSPKKASPKHQAYGLVDVDVAMTLHQVAQIYRRRHQHTAALSAYRASLRGMKRSLGERHANVAAVLGNIANLKKEMGNVDAAYEIYQEVLRIETHLFGVAHPEVTITLHNIATIESARGEHGSAIKLYKEVISLQRKLFGVDHITVAVTAACLGDSYEKQGDHARAMTAYEEALRVRTSTLGKNHVEVGRLMHKLGKIAIIRKEFRAADACVHRSLEIYRLNKIADQNPWIRDAMRDCADIDAALAFGEGMSSTYEC
eukprot:scaffold111947_cov56-Attheya_sp.AAC.1